MTTQEQYAICLCMIEALSKYGSWCGETHIQKASYVMQTLGIRQNIWDFVLYKHGPYSFDLHSTIGDLKRMDFLFFKVQPPYGPQIRLSETGRALLQRHSDTIENYSQSIENTASLLAGKGVQQLEKIGTALLLDQEHINASNDFLAERIHEVKSHIPVAEALAAVNDYRELAKNFEVAGQ